LPAVPRLLAVLTASLLIAACGGSSSKTPAESTATATPAAKQTATPSQPFADLDASKTYVATVKTSYGAFQITLDAKRAPKTGGSFKSLADKKFFDGLTFHRIVPDFVIQGGDPKGDGTGGPGYSVTETPPQDLKYTKGVVAMAKTQNEPPGTAGSQFYVVTGADAGLPPDYAVIGKVTQGISTVDRIGRLGDQSEQPTQPVVVYTITARGA
jgi:cyclophilin family peptidyl-prolyl cis-trans isomerase